MIRQAIGFIAVAGTLALGAGEATAQAQTNPCAAKNPVARGSNVRGLVMGQTNIGEQPGSAFDRYPRSQR
ncbi:MAG: hypothetical protein HY359_04580 [Candidatus Rokubacteria bacterium]|nr:hypothetical protein [Candidatus Rokubacteria bacterium]